MRGESAPKFALGLLHLGSDLLRDGDCDEDPEFQGKGSPLAAMRRRYHSSRVNSKSAAFAASRMRSGVIDPMIGWILLGCRKSQARATTTRLGPRPWAMASRAGTQFSG